MQRRLAEHQIFRGASRLCSGTLLLGTPGEDRGQNQDDAEGRDSADTEHRQVEGRDVGFGDQERPDHAHEDRPDERADAHTPAGRLGQVVIVGGRGRRAPRLRAVATRRCSRRPGGCSRGSLRARASPGLVSRSPGSPERSGGRGRRRLTRGRRIEGCATPRCGGTLVLAEDRERIGGRRLQGRLRGRGQGARHVHLGVLRGDVDPGELIGSVVLGGSHGRFLPQLPDGVPEEVGEGVGDGVADGVAEGVADGEGSDLLHTPEESGDCRIVR